MRLILLMDLVIFGCDQIWTRKGAGTTHGLGPKTQQKIRNLPIQVLSNSGIEQLLLRYSIFQDHDLEVLRQYFTRDFRHETKCKG